jgi:glyoxylase-like metal-dependent hydrolase (beta-lactamase superfamily II)
VLPTTQEQTLPELPIARGLYGLRVVMVNLYAVVSRSGAWTLVDAGLPFSATRIRRWASTLFGTASRPQAIVLTHGHFDHVGALKELSEEWDVPIYAHPLEMPYITGKSKYPPPDPTVGGGMMASLSFLYPRGPIDVGNRATPLPADGSIPTMPGWRWVHTPGHTPGHVSFFRDEDRVLIAGDAFITTRQESAVAIATQRLEWHGPPAYYTSDWEAAQLSVERLAGLQPNVVATGHGLPVSGADAAANLDTLAERFWNTEVPLQGRYVGHPAVSNEDGVVSVPPSVESVWPRVVAITAAAGLAYYAYSRTRRRASTSL